MRISDWSSDVCSSDLSSRDDESEGGAPQGNAARDGDGGRNDRLSQHQADVLDQRRRGRGGGPDVRQEGSRARDRKSVVSGKSVSVRVDRGGRRMFKKKRQKSKKT